MGYIDRLKDWWKKFKTEFATDKRIEEQVSREQIDDIDEALDYDRGVARGRQKEEEGQRKATENSVSNDRQKNVSEYLQKQKQQLQDKNFENATSVKKLLQISERQGVDLLSRDMQQKFGELDDIWFTQTGQIALTIEQDNGRPVPISVGAQTTDIFRNPGGLRNEVKNGVIAMNVNKKGQPVSSIENQTVPDMIMGPNGEFTYTESDQREAMEVIGEKVQQISQLSQRAGAAERAMVQMSNRLDEMERELETSESISEANREALERRLSEMNNTLGQFDQMERETARMSNMKQMSEQALRDVQGKRDELTEMVASDLNKDDMDAKEDEIRRISNLTIDMMMQAADASGSISNNSDNNGGSDMEGEL